MSARATPVLAPADRPSTDGTVAARPSGRGVARQVPARRRLWAALALPVLAWAGLVVLPTAVGAAPDDLVIHVDGAVYGAPGDLIVVDQVLVDPTLVGASCTGVATTHNNESVHPGTTLVVTTGVSQVELDHVEDVSEGVTQASQAIVLGEAITVSVRLGDDGVASGGTTLSFDCAATPPTTTTSTNPTTTTTVPTTLAPTTMPTTTIPPTTVPTSIAAPTTRPETAAATVLTSTPSTFQRSPEAVTGPELPFTGSSATEPLIVIGAVLVLVGAVLRRLARQR